MGRSFLYISTFGFLITGVHQALIQSKHKGGLHLVRMENIALRIQNGLKIPIASHIIRNPGNMDAVSGDNIHNSHVGRCPIPSVSVDTAYISESMGYDTSGYACEIVHIQPGIQGQCPRITSVVQ